jgi:nitroreductase
MIDNPVIRALMNRKSIRSYTDRDPSDEVIETVVRAGQQAPFAAQLYSFLLSRDRKKIPFHAPLLFTICADVHRLELFMAERRWTLVTHDLPLLLFAIQDACYAAENMVIAAESLGMGSCFLGAAPYHAERIIEAYKLPKRVFPLVQLAMGYPAENPPVRPRFPLEFSLFEDAYPALDEKAVREAMKVMDDGYLEQDYYRNINYKVPLTGDREETFTFDDYGWTEHISRKWGQWYESPDELLRALAACGFKIEDSEDRIKDSANP